jgi:hypothetical protein
MFVGQAALGGGGGGVRGLCSVLVRVRVEVPLAAGTIPARPLARLLVRSPTGLRPAAGAAPGAQATRQRRRRGGSLPLALELDVDARVESLADSPTPDGRDAAHAKRERGPAVRMRVPATVWLRSAHAGDGGREAAGSGILSGNGVHDEDEEEDDVDNDDDGEEEGVHVCLDLRALATAALTAAAAAAGGSGPERALSLADSARQACTWLSVCVAAPFSAPPQRARARLGLRAPDSAATTTWTNSSTWTTLSVPCAFPQQVAAVASCAVDGARGGCGNEDEDGRRVGDVAGEPQAAWAARETHSVAAHLLLLHPNARWAHPASDCRDAACLYVHSAASLRFDEPVVVEARAVAAPAPANKNGSADACVLQVRVRRNPSAFAFAAASDGDASTTVLLTHATIKPAFPHSDAVAVAVAGQSLASLLPLHLSPLPHDSRTGAGAQPLAGVSFLFAVARRPQSAQDGISSCGADTGSGGDAVLLVFSLALALASNPSSSLSSPTLTPPLVLSFPIRVSLARHHRRLQAAAHSFNMDTNLLQLARAKHPVAAALSSQDAQALRSPCRAGLRMSVGYPTNALLHAPQRFAVTFALALAAATTPAGASSASSSGSGSDNKHDAEEDDTKRQAAACACACGWLRYAVEYDARDWALRGRVKGRLRHQRMCACACACTCVCTELGALEVRVALEMTPLHTGCFRAPRVRVFHPNELSVSCLVNARVRSTTASTSGTGGDSGEGLTSSACEADRVFVFADGAELRSAAAEASN